LSISERGPLRSRLVVSESNPSAAVFGLIRQIGFRPWLGVPSRWLTVMIG